MSNSQLKMLMLMKIMKYKPEQCVFTYHDAHRGKTLSNAANVANLLSMIFVCFLRMWQRFFCKLKIHLMMHTGEILPYRNLINVTNVTSLLSMFFCENYWKQNLYKWNLMNVANVFDKVFPQCASWYVKLYIRTWFSPVWVMICKATLLWFIYIVNVNKP